jgi:predicted lysophospholipase L1 biosynthesis ABC-type transport system permease subunit
MRIGLVAGRLFTEADGSASEPVVVINQEFARRYFGAANPVGRSMHIMKGSSEPDRPRVVVGIVADVKSENFRAAAPPTVFVPLEQAPDAHLATANHFFQANWVVRTRSSGAGLAAAMQRELRAVDPLQPFSGFRTLEEIRASAIRQDRSMTILLSAFAVVALLLAAMGIYGVIAYSVAQRAHEIGIRLALGATPAAVVRRVVGGATVLALVGIAAGAAGAFGLTRFLARFIYGVQADDPATFAGAGVLLMAVALTASVIPALRVTRLDPARALRVE